jgi:hypothetical protein
MKLETLA